MICYTIYAHHSRTYQKSLIRKFAWYGVASENDATQPAATGCLRRQKAVKAQQRVAPVVS